MSGTRQHFVPQFLQEGFASHVTNRAAFTWVHRKGAASFNTNIINVGVEGKFYTTEQDATVDDLITSAEGPFGSLIANLRADAPHSLTHPQLPHLIAHLETRTRHLRQNFLQTGELIVSAMQLSMPLVPALLQSQRSEFSKLACVLRNMLPAIFRNAAKSGHIRALSKSIAPMARVQRYESLSYRVEKVDDAPLILGDSIVLFGVGGARRYKTFLDSDDVLNAVFLPLDTERMLIGTHQDNFSTLPSDLRVAIARCSLEYFIASDSSPELENLKKQIGADAYLLTQKEIEDMLSGTWQH